MTEYIFYRVPEINKVGMTIDFEKRKTLAVGKRPSYDDLGYNPYILEKKSFPDMTSAHEHERELQRQYGAKIDTVTYEQSRANLKNGCKSGGSVKGNNKGGMANVASGHWARVQPLGRKLFWWNNGITETRALTCPEGFVRGRLAITCPNCGDKGCPGEFYKHHFANCKGPYPKRTTITTKEFLQNKKIKMPPRQLTNAALKVATERNIEIKTINAGNSARAFPTELLEEIYENYLK